MEHELRPTEQGVRMAAAARALAGSGRLSRAELGLDLFSEPGLRDPHPLYREIRDCGPAVWLPATRGATPIPTASTSRATPATTSPSATACTAARAATLRSSSSKRSRRPSSAACAASRSARPRR